MARKIFTQDPDKYIPVLAEALKKVEQFQIPEWANFVKTGTSKQRPPMSEDFWYTRAASILRQLYLRGVVGVGKLRTRYGSKKDRGTRPDEFRKASGKIIRVILQQAEEAGFVEKVTRLQHGRRLTKQGRDFLDSIEIENDAPINPEEVKIKNVPQEPQEDEQDNENLEQENMEEEKNGE